MTAAERLLGLARRYYNEFLEALEEYRGGSGSVYAVERLAQLLAQSILDAAAVMAAREEGAKPGTYRELARWLARRARLPRDLEEFLVGLAGFRNILVHMYAEIDRDLEERAFDEIASTAPRLLALLERVVRGDPCLEDVAEAVARAAPRLGLRLVLAFGSLARRGCGRDVDLAVRLGRRPASLLEVGRIQAELEAEVGAPVDLVVLDLPVDPALAKSIVDSWRLLYGSPREAELEVLRLYKVYLDWRGTRGRGM